MRRQFYTLVCLVLAVSAFGQDWTSDASNLYYVTKDGKVYLEADHSAMAIYFRGTPDEGVESKFRVSLLKAGRSSAIPEDGIQMMELKGMMRIKSVSGLSSIRSSIDRKAFLQGYGLEKEGAYDVLPAFKVDGMQAWLTKRVIIRLKDGINFDQVQDLVTRYNASFVKNLTDANTYILQMDEIQHQFTLIHEINDRGLLDWGEPDFKMEIVRRVDPFYQYQWHLNNTGGTDLGGKALLNDADIDAPEAWGVATGTNVTVAVIDDGLEAHEDLATLLPGYTPANGGNGTPSLSTDGHGQQCGGLIGALHNEIGVRGVAPGVDMFSVNIFAPNTTNADVADGINWAVNNGADVLSNSWGYTSCTTNISSVTSAFNNAATNGRGGLGCIILVASGNDFNTCVSYPADLPSVTAVGGISGDGERSNFSNYGPALDIVAPSNDDWVFNGLGQLISTAHDLVTIDREGSAGWFSGNYSDGFGGTSGATPIAAGVAALVLSVNPALTKAEVENILYTTADDIGPSGFDNEYGNGRVNAYQAVLAAGGSVDNTPPSTPNGLASSNVQTTSFDLSWNASSDDVGVAGYNVYLNGSSIGSVSGPSASVTGLAPSTTYSVTVSAFDGAGNESGQSSSINVTTGAASLSCASTVSSYPYGEGFESGDGWTQAGGDDGDWYRTSGNTPSSNTGPTSAGEGSFYLFLEASTNGSPGQIGNNATAILESDCFDLSGASTATFSFQNHMYGTNVGSLTLEVSVDDLTWSSLWNDSGSNGNQWNSVDVNLDTYAGSVIRLRFVGTTGNGWSSDIAIDDLSLTTGSGGDTEAPSTPTALSASNVGETSFDISWNASSDNVGVTGYNVYLNGSLDGSTASTSYSFSGLSSSTTYSVAVEAVDAAGNTSGQASTNVTTADPPGGCSNVTVNSNDFEGGWGIWNDGGSDARRSANDAAYSNGTYSIRLRDNTSTSVMTTDNIDLSSFEDITVSFSYVARSMDNSNEDFWLQVSTNGGSSFTTVEEWNQGDEFVNLVRENDAVTISGPFTSTTQLRFRCDASGNSDWVYIDDVVITGCSASASAPIVITQSSQALSLDNDELDLRDIELYPNPVKNLLRINGMPEGANVRLMSLSGRVLTEGKGLKEVDMTGLQPGLYLLQVSDKGEEQSFKIIKQ